MEITLNFKGLKILHLNLLVEFWDCFLNKCSHHCLDPFYCLYYIISPPKNYVISYKHTYCSKELLLLTLVLAWVTGTKIILVPSFLLSCWYLFDRCGNWRISYRSKELETLAHHFSRNACRESEQSGCKARSSKSWNFEYVVDYFLNPPNKAVFSKTVSKKKTTIKYIISKKK